jgi:hypothetical protein
MCTFLSEPAPPFAFGIFFTFGSFFANFGALFAPLPLGLPPPLVSAIDACEPSGAAMLEGK